MNSSPVWTRLIPKHYMGTLFRMVDFLKDLCKVGQFSEGIFEHSTGGAAGGMICPKHQCNIARTSLHLYRTLTDALCFISDKFLNLIGSNRRTHRGPVDGIACPTLPVRNITRKPL